MNCELQFHDLAVKRVNGVPVKVCTFCGQVAPAVEDDEASETAVYDAALTAAFTAALEPKE